LLSAHMGEPFKLSPGSSRWPNEGAWPGCTQPSIACL
jgi:hypothetical protein